MEFHDSIRRTATGEKLVSELQDHVKDTLAPYKYPREIEFVEGFPHTETGKIQRGKLREREREAVEQSVDG